MCVPYLNQSLLPPADDDTHWTQVIGAVPTLQREVTQAIDDAKRMCPSAWNEDCLVGGPPEIDHGFTLITAALHSASEKGGQGHREDGSLMDFLAIQIPGTDKWEMWHLFGYGDGCLRPRKFDGTWEYHK